MRQLAVSRI